MFRNGFIAPEDARTASEPNLIRPVPRRRAVRPRSLDRPMQSK